MKTKITRLIISSYVILFSSFCLAQESVFNTSIKAKANQKSSKLIEHYKVKENRNNQYLIEVNSDIFNSKKLSFTINGTTVSADFVKKIVRGEDDFTWFGKTEDKQGIFFYVKNGKVSSKFISGGYAYTMIPLEGNNSLLIEFEEVDVGECGIDEEIIFPIEPRPRPRPILTDTNCNLRVLVSTTAAARTEILADGIDIPTFCQLAVDETNLAYINSQIGITMELATVLETNYAELNNNISQDVENFKDGAGALNITHTYRNLYNTDVQILIRSSAGADAFGIAAQVPTNDSGNNFNQFLGYAVVAVNGITSGRFTFAHEVAHLQGARHSNDNRSPNYARAYSTSNVKTILAFTSSNCTGVDCRIGFFSNPDAIGPTGDVVGTNDRDNARRIHESRNIVNSYRVTPTTLNLSNETIPANYVSNHLGKTRVDTNNRNVFYRNNSVGTMRAEAEIIMRPGTTIEQGSDFRAYTVDDACEELPFRQAGIIESEETSPSNSITVFPNPATDLITISFEKETDNFNLELYGLNSKNKVLSQSYIVSQKEVTLDVSQLKSGIYLLRFIKGDTVQTYKIIKN